MREAVASREIVRSLKARGAWALKIPDPGLGEIKSGAARRPFDILFISPRGSGGIEVKQIKKWKPFGIKEVEEHQIEHLEKVRDAGGIGLVFLNVRIPYKENRLIAWRIESLINADRYSREQLKDLPYTAGAKGSFDLESLTIL